MTLEIRIDGVLITNRIRLTGGSRSGVAGLPAAAFYGQMMTAGMSIDDPIGDFDVEGWHTVTVDETACSKPRVFTGWITGTKWSRPPGGPNTGPGRVIDCDIMDINNLFAFEVFRSTAASVYPDQTDLERIEQARASHAMAATPIVDNGRVSADDPRNLTAVNMVGQYPGELFTSTAGQSGKNFYAYWDDDEDEISLHYAPVGDGPAASWGVSNVIADVDNDTVFYPFVDGELSRSPENVNTGVLLGYAGGRWVYASDPDLIGPNEFSPVNFLRDLVYQTDRIGLTSTANAVAATTLALHSAEKETLTFTARVPAAKVNLAHAGDIIPVRFTHLRGFETEVTIPIIRRNVVPSPGRRDMYDITFECGASLTDRGPGGGPGGPFQSSCSVDDISLVQTKTEIPNEDTGTTSHITLDSAPTPGNLQIIITEYDDPVAPTNSLVPDGYTAVTGILSSSATDQNFQVQAWRRVAQSGDTTTVTQTKTGNSARRVTYLEFGGAIEFDVVDTEEVDTDDPSPLVAGTVTPTAGAVVLLVSAIVPSLNVGDGWVPTPTAGPTTAVSYGSAGASPYIWTGYQIVASASGSYAHSVTYTDGGILRGYAGVMMAFICNEAAASPPPHLTIVRGELIGEGDGTTVTFETNFPYEPGSLEVFVDGVAILNGLTETDPSAGTFTLDFAPLGATGDTRAEIVTATYLTGA